MAKTKNDNIEEKVEPLVRRGEAVPVDPATGAPAAELEAPLESTSHVLAQQEDSPESREPSLTGQHYIGNAFEKEQS